MQLDINTDAAVRFTAMLERMHKSAMPIAIRNTLNSAAFDVKKTSMPAQADKQFERRQANFFKANSKVDMAKGFNIRSMEASVGFIPLAGTNRAVDDLEQQEHGGTIGGRSFIPLKQSRTGNSWTKKVKNKFKISDIANKIVDSKDGSGKNDEEKFIRSALHAGKGGYVLGNRENGQGNRTLYFVASIIRGSRIKNDTKKQYGNWDTVVKLIPIYAVKGGRKVQPKATHFMRTASLQSAGRMEALYIEHAEKQIAKLKV